MLSTKNMKTRNVFGFLVAVMALFLVLPSASAFVDIQEVNINGIEIDNPGSSASVDVGAFAGDTISVRTTFTASQTDEEARVTARIIGEPGSYVDTSEFAVLSGNTYSRLLNVELPFDLDDNLDEFFTLEVTIEGKDTDSTVETEIRIDIQRENDVLQILALESNDEVSAGENLILDAVVKNRGRQEAEDTFVRVTIPALGISKTVYIADLSAVDDGIADEEDAALGRVYLNIPRGTPAGVYNVEVHAFNDESSVVATRKVVVLGANAESDVITSRTSRTFATGEEQMYTMTIVNADNRIRVYELILETANGLEVELDESLVAVPAGSSKTVRLTTVASDEGNYNFAVNVHSNGELVEKQNFVANVQGRSGSVGSTGNAAVVLTIILAIIFVVLLVVLIVLLTRKPEKSEDFGESYY